MPRPRRPEEPNEPGGPDEAKGPEGHAPTGSGSAEPDERDARQGARHGSGSEPQEDEGHEPGQARANRPPDHRPPSRPGGRPGSAQPSRPGSGPRIDPHAPSSGAPAPEAVPASGAVFASASGPVPVPAPDHGTPHGSESAPGAAGAPGSAPPSGPSGISPGTARGPDPGPATTPWRTRCRRAGRVGAQCRAARRACRPREGRRLRSTAAALTALTALAASSLVAGSAVADRRSAPCALGRTRAHHSEGVDTWNAAYPRPRRSLDALLVFLSFPDARPRYRPDELLADYFPATTRFYERASYGRFTLRPHAHRAWLRMPAPSTTYRIRRDWDDAHRAAYLRDAVAVADPEIDFGKYDIVYFVADPDAPGVDSDATKVVNFDRAIRVDGTDLRRIVTVFERHPPDRNVLAHETGHVFDLPDLYHRPSDGKGDWDTYVGDWDVMGSQFGLAPEFFGWHKWRLGWLDPDQVVCVQSGGVTQLVLEPLSGPARSSEPAGPAGAVASSGAGRPRHPSGPHAPGTAANPGPRPGAGTVRDLTAGTPESLRSARLVVLRTGRTSAIAMEARSAQGNDATVCTQGVLVYRVRTTAESGGGPVEVIDAHPHTAACRNNSVYPALADAPVRAGEHFRVPHERLRIDLTVGARTRTGAWPVRITTK